MKLPRLSNLAAVAFAMAALVSCDRATESNLPTGLSASLVPLECELIVCKVCPDCPHDLAFRFTVDWTEGGSPMSTEHWLTPGQCETVHEWYESEIPVTVMEWEPAGWVVARIEGAPGGTLYDTNKVGPAFLAGHLLTFYNVPENGGGEGCTPGYWKTKPHADDWDLTPYAYDDLYDDVFGVENNIGSSLTLHGAVSKKGNTYNSFVRHSVAALLNAAHPGVDYDLTADEVKAVVQDAHATGAFDSAKNLFLTFNEQGCSIP